MNNNLYILRPVGYTDDFKVGAWDPWYDKAFGYVVSAPNEDEARKLAAMDAKYDTQLSLAWLDAKQSTCKLLEASTETKIIITDFRAA